MLVHYDRRLAFICHPRTASHATSKALRRAGFEYTGNHHQIDEEFLKPWARSVACTVRNPIDVLVSWYHYDKATEPIGEWFEKRWRRKVWTQNGMFYGLRYCDTVLEFASVQDDLNAWLKRFGIGPQPIPQMNVTEKRGAWWGWLDTEFNIKLCDMMPRPGRFHS